MTEELTAVQQLINKAAGSTDSADALRFSQAALNVAHAEQVAKQNK